MVVDPTQSTVGLLETRLEGDGMLQISNRLFGAESIRPGPGELGTSDVGFCKVRIQRERLLDLDKGFLLPAGIWIVLKEPENVSSSQRACAREKAGSSTIAR